MGKKKTKFWVALAVIIGVMGALIYFTTSSQSVYYMKPSEIIAKVKKDATVHNDRIRIGGIVVNEKIKGNSVGREWKFHLTDERGNIAKELVMVSLKSTKPTDTINVDYKGVVPDTFKPGGMAIVEGTYDRDGIFRADSLLAKCPSKYVGVKPAKPKK